ncbi:MAG: hypothetical protein JRM72_04900 [Nitrososphaerota archaeon]|nr:hypothetical protein [Nitrososphaerota archaeon]
MHKSFVILNWHKVTVNEPGLEDTTSFIRKNSMFMVTFTKLAVQGSNIPYTSNMIERLMGEVSKRCKHKWAHWSMKGLENVLHIVLTRYMINDTHELFYNVYIKPSADP